MAGGFTKEFMDELKYKCDIVDVISQYVPLTKKGGKYFGCCPFHNEKTASFCVMQAQGYFHCFGCGVSGDVVKFVQDIESVSFFDAVKILAERAGMMLPE
ncbi:MAG: CHC2 zinc finger domain-containing protein, partial [Clostridia bacterium]